MAQYNDCRFEGTLWNPSLATTPSGESVFKGKLSVYKAKNGDKYEYQTIHIRSYGEKADKMNHELRERAKVKVRGLLRLEIYNEQPYLTLKVDEWEDITNRPVGNNSPYRQNYKPEPKQKTFEEIQKPVIDDGLPF